MLGVTVIEVYSYSYSVHFHIYINIQSKCKNLSDFGKYPRQVSSCTHNKIVQRDTNSDINLHHLCYAVIKDKKQQGGEPTPGRELQLPRLGCQTRETCLSKNSYSLLWLSGSKPSKLCRHICKALRGNNGQNLKT